MGPQPVPATICRGGQTLQPRCRERQRAELHNATRHVNVGNHAVHAAEQEAIARGVERVVQRGLEFGRIAAAENLRQEIPKGNMIAGLARNHRRSRAAFAGSARRCFVAATHVGGDRRLNPCAHERESFSRETHCTDSDSHYQNIFTRSWEVARREKNSFFVVRNQYSHKKSFYSLLGRGPLEKILQIGFRVQAEAIFTRTEHLLVPQRPVRLRLEFQ